MRIVRSGRPSTLVRAVLAAAAVAAGTLAPTGPAAAQQAAPDRSWTQVEFASGQQHLGADFAPAGIGGTVAVYNAPGSRELRVRSRGLGDPFGAAQVLDHDGLEPTVAASVLGGEVAAWYHEPTREVRIAERGPGDSAFAAPSRTPSTGANYGYGRPFLAVGSAGDAAVAYLVAAGDGRHQLVARIRPAGGVFGPPEAVSPPLPVDAVYARDLDVGADGTVVVGFAHSGRAAVAVRPPGGPFAAPERLGGPAPEHSWRSPQVGVSATGDVAALWLEDAGRYSGPVRVAFRPRGADAFGQPRPFGDVEATDLGRLHLGVSAVGEVVAAVESTSSLDGGGGSMEGIQVAYGDARRSRLGEPVAITPRSAHYPSFAMNERGDALVVYDDFVGSELRVVARRRAPVGSFGPPVEVAPPIVLTGVRGGISVVDAELDAFGMGRAAWYDDETEQLLFAEDGPQLETAPPEVPALGEQLAPVLPPAPETSGPPAELPEPPGVAPPPIGSAAADPTVARLGDTRAPSVRLGRPGRVIAGARGRAARLRLTLRCSERCRARVAARLGTRPLRPVGVEAAAGRTVGFDLALPRRAPSRALRLHVGAADAAGNVRTVRRAFALPRR